MFVRETGGINRQQWEKLCRHTAQNHQQSDKAALPYYIWHQEASVWASERSARGGRTAGRLRLHARHQTKMTAVVLGGALVRAPSGPVSGAKVSVNPHPSAVLDTGQLVQGRFQGRGWGRR